MKSLVSVALTLLALMPAMSQPQTKLSRYLSELSLHQATTRHLPPAEQPRVTVLMKLSSGQAASSLAETYGYQLLDSIGAIYVVSIPVGQLSPLADEPAVIRIEANPMPRTEMDTTAFIIHADRVHEGQALPQAFTGQGVVTGIVDTGFDFTHPAFYDENGQLRVNNFYDFKTHRGYTSAADIRQLARSSNAGTDYHGTHTMSIMAGSRSKYSGIAYDGDICAAEFSCTVKDIHPQDGTTADVILAFKHVFDYAAEQGKPCVINFSVSGNPMWSDPYQLENEALAGLTGPGRIIVAANGNFGHAKYYMPKPAGQASAGTLYKGFISNNGSLWFDLRAQGDQLLTVSVPSGDQTSLLGGITFATADVDTAATQSIYKAEVIGNTNLRVTVTHVAEMDSELGKVYSVKVVTGHMFSPLCAIKIEGDDKAELLAERPLATFNNLPDVEGYDCSTRGYTVHWPADQQTCIGVGATGHRFNYINLKGNLVTDDEGSNENGVGGLAKFSGRGPALDNRTKPDACAPGVDVRAAYCSYYGGDDMKNQLVDTTTFNGKTYHWIALQGTSMATPVMAGTVALWLQAKPDLTVDDIRDVLAHTARQPDATLNYPNNLYGYGEVDAYRGLLYILGLPDAISHLSLQQPASVHITLNGRRLSVQNAATGPLPDAPATFTVYTISGRQVATAHGPLATLAIDLTALPDGVYAVQLTTSAATATGSTLIRL